MTESEPMATCALCKRTVPAMAILAHLRIVHDMDVTIETWPDGDPVIVDKTLEPDDFEASS